MENKASLLITLIVLFGIINLFGLFIVGGNQVDEQALSDKITAQVIQQIPTPEKPQVIDVDALAIDVAGKINIPEYVQPEFDSKFEDMWEKDYAEEIEELETEAYNVAEIELEKRDYRSLERYLESTIENFDELEDVDNYDFDDCEITIKELGLDEDEDKIAEVACELKVEYSLLEGIAQDWKKTIYATATVSFDEGDFSDEDVEFVFA